MAAQPKTAEEIAALPIGPAIRTETFTFTDADRAKGFIMIHGKRYDIVVPCSSVRVPVMPDVKATFHAEGDTISYTDDTGTWMLGAYADGTFFRRRM